MESAGSQILSEAISPLIRKRFAFKETFNSQHQPHTYAIEHKLILKAIRQRNVERAVNCLTDHIARALNTHIQTH